MSAEKFEHSEYLEVVAMTPTSAKDFFGRDDEPVDLGPANSGRYKEGARVWGFKIHPKTHVQHTLSVTVQVPLTWMRYLTYDSSIFGRDYAGYWLCGVAYEENLGWLCYEEIDGEAVDDDRCEAVKKLWLAGAELPPRWFRLNKMAALRAWEEGVKRWGVDWYQETDARREDVVVQLALLGEVRYG